MPVESRLRVLVGVPDGTGSLGLPRLESGACAALIEREAGVLGGGIWNADSSAEWELKDGASFCWPGIWYCKQVSDCTSTKMSALSHGGRSASVG
jgi:hypothetical protein